MRRANGLRMRVRRLLCPVDFSEHAAFGLRAAQTLAAASEASAHLVHVWEQPKYSGPDVTLLYERDGITQFATFSLATDQRDALREALSQAPSATIHVRADAGRAHSAIATLASLGDFDAIVIATHRRRGFAHFWLGSVAENLLHEATCPVLTVSPSDTHSQEHPMTEIKKILCPIDFSEGAEAALNHAVEFAERFDATVDLLHVYETPSYVRPDLSIWVTAHTSEPLTKYIRAEAEKNMEEFGKGLNPTAKARVEQQLVKHGDPASDIGRIAKEGSYDLIVMGTHGRSGFNHLLMGSVAERVVRQAQCPVMTVRHPDNKTSK